MVVAELEKTLSSFPVVDSVVSLLDGVVEKLSALKRKVSDANTHQQAECLHARDLSAAAQQQHRAHLLKIRSLWLQFPILTTMASLDCCSPTKAVQACQFCH